MKIPTALTLAGSDPSGGAGAQADLKTFHQLGVYGMAVITLLTVQNTRGVKKIYVLKRKQVMEQLRAVLEDIKPKAVKTGALGSPALIDEISRAFRKAAVPLIVDPVMVSKHGASLLKKEAVRALKKQLLPLATLVTPNIAEAELLSGCKIRHVLDMEQAAFRILKDGPKAVLIKGGHLKGEATDLFCDGKISLWLKARRCKTRNTHGTGCTYAAAITAEVAKGKRLDKAVQTAKKFISQAIRTAPAIRVPSP